MKKYTLKNNFGESISYTFADSIEEAQVFFSKMKNLEINKLLKIFTIEEISLG